MRNDFCDMSDLRNEADVEMWFVLPLLRILGYTQPDIALKTAIQELKIGKGRKAELYRPDFILKVEGIPAVVIDAKAPSEEIERWEHQCSSYCLELNKLFDFNPVQYFMITNGIKTAIYQWDIKRSLVVAPFSAFTGNDGLYETIKALLHIIDPKN